MRAKIYIFFLFFISALNMNAQVLINRPVELTNSANTKVENLHTPNDSTAGLNVDAVQSNKFLYADAVGSNTIQLTTPVNVQPVKGMVLYFKAAANNTNEVFLKINGNGNYPLLKNTSDTLEANDIKGGSMLVISYDGINFQYLNYNNPDCPSGFIAVTDEYCIEVNESIAIDSFYNAIVDCYSRNARLCNWGEWYYACVSLGASLNNMTNNWEYTDDAGNEVDMVRICGNGSCAAAGCQNIPVNAPKKYRCCYSRK